MNRVVAGLKDTKVYVDDLIIHSETWESHLEQIELLFQRLVEFNLTVNLVKSEIGHATVIFLGHIVCQGKVSPVQAKVEAISKLPPPVNKKGVMRFLRVTGYYRKFCPIFADVVTPLTNLLRKETKFQWFNLCQAAFQKIKNVLMSSPVLQAPNFSKAFSLATDASDVGFGAMLTQKDDGGVDHPVAYYSKKFDKHQVNYSTIEKEALALQRSLEHFEVYIQASPHTAEVYTDHNPLTFVNKMKTKSRRLLNWSLAMQEYNLNINHIKGKDNIIPDALSRSC